MNDFFLRVEASNKSGTVYRVYARETNGEAEDRRNTALKNSDLLKKDQSPPAQAKRRRKGQKRRIKGKRCIASANSWRINLIEPYIKETMKRNAPAKGLQRTLDGNTIQPQASTNGDLVIDEEDGVRLSILFKSISRLQKMARIDSILANVRTMNREEAYYWYSKIFPYKKNKKGLKSFRDLFG